MKKKNASSVIRRKTVSRSKSLKISLQKKSLKNRLSADAFRHQIKLPTPSESRRIPGLIHSPSMHELPTYNEPVSEETQKK